MTTDWHALPPIYLRIRTSRRQFLLDMGAIASATGCFTVEHIFDDPVAAGVFSEASNFRALASYQHDEFGFQLLCRIHSPQRVDIEVRATRWHPHDPPTRDDYVDAARTLLRPLLRSYNSTHGTRVPMHVASAKSLQPKLPPRPAALLHSFAVQANTRSLHPLDWGRFYRFVKSLRQPERYGPHEIQWLLRNEGIPEKMASDLGRLFEHLAAFKVAR